MIIKKTINTKTYDVYKIVKGFFKCDETWKQVRGKNEKCFKCSKEFQDGNNINLGFVYNYKNIMLCDKCVESIAGNSFDIEILDKGENK